MNHISVNNIELSYDVLGKENKETVLLIAGLGTQMLRWTIPFCQLLVDKGFRVIRFDNRDTGQSTHFSKSKTISMQELIQSAQDGKLPEIPYTLFDMAKDAIGLLDALSIDKAHIVGRSMGGIIAQLMASEYPERVSSMTSIMSTSLNPTLPQAEAQVMGMMLQPKPDYNTDAKGFLEKSLMFAKRIAGSKYPLDEQMTIDILTEERKRSAGENGLMRQVLAIAATGYDKERLAQITAPSLIIHGSEDPIFPVECGRDTAASIPNSKLLVLDGMGHDIPAELYATVVDAMLENATCS